jgi:hypothetical protein
MSYAQTRIDLRTQSKSVDFSAATSTKPSKTGTTLPAACSIGETFLKTDAAAGHNFYACTGVNVWTVQGGNSIPNAVDKTTANTYTAGATQTFVPGTSASGVRLTPGTLPSAPQPGDLAVDVADSNHAKVFDGTSWVNMTTVPNYSKAFSGVTSIVVPGTEHKMGTGNLMVQIYDNRTPAWVVEPDYVLINSTTFDVTAYFANPQSGRIVISAAGGGAGSGTISPGAGIVTVAVGAQTQISVDPGTVPTYLTAAAALDFPSIASAGCSELTLALPGAAIGDAVAAGWPGGLEAGLIGTMRVNAANSIAVRVCNFSGAALNPTSATFRATVVRNF